MNTVLLQGIVSKVEKSVTPKGTAVAKLTVKTTEKGKGGKLFDSYHRVVAWAELADVQLQQGAPVFVQGKLNTRSWDGRDGKKNYITEVVAREMFPIAVDPVQAEIQKQQDQMQESDIRQQAQAVRNRMSGAPTPEQVGGMKQVAQNQPSFEEDVPF